MSGLLGAIKKRDAKAGSVLKEAGFCTDSDIQSLTRQDLNELFPEVKNLKLRKDLFQIIHKEKNPLDQLIVKPKATIPEGLPKAPTGNYGHMADYINELKVLKAQINGVLDDRIAFLENGSGIGLPSSSATSSARSPAVGSYSGQALDCSPGGKGSYPCSSNSLGSAQDFQMETNHCSAGGYFENQNFQMETNPSSAGSNSDENQLKYRIVVCGETFGAHHQFMKKLEEPHPSWLVQTSDDYQITILFCVVTSRMGSDVAAAMAEVKDNKPVILVLMQHQREPKVTTNVRTWAQDNNDANVVSHVSVFYHETVRGLLKCGENDEAVLKVLNEFLKISPQIIEVARSQDAPVTAAQNDEPSRNWKDPRTWIPFTKK